MIPVSNAEARRVVELMAERKLQPRDAAVLTAVMVFMSPRTYSTTVTCQHIADVLKMHRPHVSASVTRLAKTGVLVRTYNSCSRTIELALPQDIVQHDNRYVKIGGGVVCDEIDLDQPLTADKGRERAWDPDEYTSPLMPDEDGLEEPVGPDGLYELDALRRGGLEVAA